MAGRPYWSGQIRISLVSFPITLSSALRSGSRISLHEIDRNTGSRIHHLNVNEDGKEVAREDIIKGYETDDDTEVLIEPDEIDDIKLPSSDTLELVTFVDIDSIPFYRFERPYFILPNGKDAGEIYATIRQALADSRKAGIGQLTMRGREELCAVLPEDGGLLLETLRYDQELVKEDDIFPELKKKLKGDYVDLANQLIKKNSDEPDFSKFHDHYHEALKELIEAKKAHRKPRLPKAGKPPAKVVDFMDALRKSLKTQDNHRTKRSHSKKSA